MKLIIGTDTTKKADALHILQQYRQQGSTSALIDAMLFDDNALMVVHSYASAKALSRQHKIDIKRFILVDNLPDGLMGRRGPLLFDIPAIVKIAEL